MPNFFNAWEIRSGMIMLWNGAVANIPSGWHLCDGTGETPDLRDKFVVAAGLAYSPGDQGGSDTISLPEAGWSEGAIAAGGRQITLEAMKRTAVRVIDNRPSYYALCYIMKV